MTSNRRRIMAGSNSVAVASNMTPAAQSGRGANDLLALTPITRANIRSQA